MPVGLNYLFSEQNTRQFLEKIIETDPGHLFVSLCRDILAGSVTVNVTINPDLFMSISIRNMAQKSEREREIESAYVEFGALNKDNPS